MRTEKEMYHLILEVAQKEERIRAVYLNGSRTNPSVPKDIFQDFDLVYVVTDIAPFLAAPSWIDCFGTRLLMQLPDEMDRMLGKETDFKNCYGYLIQLSDGNRIDLHIQTLDYTRKVILQDKLCRILLDKDQALPAVPEATDRDYWVQKPRQAQFSCCCNEFWWVLDNVAKGLWREEIPYVMDMLNHHVRPELVKMLSWSVGIQSGFSCSVGKSGKYLNQYLSPGQWERFLKTYPAANIQQIWDAVFTLCDFFQETALFVSAQLKLEYNQQEGENCLFFLHKVYSLPKDASEIL